MMRRLIRYLLQGPRRRPHVKGWNPVIAERHAAATARLLLGHAGPAHVETAAERVRRLRTDTRNALAGL